MYIYRVAYQGQVVEGSTGCIYGWIACGKTEWNTQVCTNLSKFVFSPIDLDNLHILIYSTIPNPCVINDGKWCFPSTLQHTLQKPYESHLVPA